MIYHEIARFSAGKREGWGIMGGTGELGNGGRLFLKCFAGVLETFCLKVWFLDILVVILEQR